MSPHLKYKLLQGVHYVIWTFLTSLLRTSGLHAAAIHIWPGSCHLMTTSWKCGTFIYTIRAVGPKIESKSDNMYFCICPNHCMSAIIHWKPHPSLPPLHLSPGTPLCPLQALMRLTIVASTPLTPYADSCRPLRFVFEYPLCFQLSTGKNHPNWRKKKKVQNHQRSHGGNAKHQL